MELRGNVSSSLAGEAIHGWYLSVGGALLQNCSGGAGVLPTTMHQSSQALGSLLHCGSGETLWAEEPSREPCETTPSSHSASLEPSTVKAYWLAPWTGNS